MAARAGASYRRKGQSISMPSSLRRLPHAGEPAPDFTLPATDGGTVDLAAYPKPVVLVFLRHLA